MANDKTDQAIQKAAEKALKDHKLDPKHAEALADLFKATHVKK